MSNLRQVFYVSRSIDAIDERVIRNILAISRRNNRMLDVTGCLTFTGRHFAQILEGRDTAITELTTRIAADHRHTAFRTLVDRPMVLREYPLWSMAYLDSILLAEGIEALFEAAEPAPRKTLQMMSRLKPDTVIGAL
jgi:hypothetical protein